MNTGRYGKYIFLWLSIGFLLVAVAYKYFLVTIKNTDQQNALLISAKLEKEVKTIEGSMADIMSAIRTSDGLSFRSLYRNTTYPYSIFSNKRLVFWSDNLYTPKYRDVIGDFHYAYVVTAKGKFIAVKGSVSHETMTYEIVFQIPLEEYSAVVNAYLKNTYNKKLFTDSNFELTEVDQTENYQQVTLQGQNLFSVKFGTTYSNTDANSKVVLLALIICCFGFLGAFVQGQLQHFRGKQKFGHGFLFLFCIIVIVRGLMLLIGFPLNFVQVDLFDPKHYASSLVNPSLGDLLLNVLSLLVLGYYLFVNFFRLNFVRRLLYAGKRPQFVAACTFLFFSFFWLAVHHQAMKTLNFDSQWSMDITQNLEFDYLRGIGFLIYFISVVVYFLFAHVCFRMYIQLIPRNTKKHVFSMIIAIASFSLLTFLLRWDFVMVIVVNASFFLGIYYFSLPKFIGRFHYLTFIYLFSFGLPGAIVGLYANYQYGLNKANFNKSRLANQLLVESNFFTEMQLADVAKKIKDDFFIQKRIFSPYASKQIIEKKIRLEYLNNLNKFDIKIYVFNSRGEPFEHFNIKDNYHDFKARLKEYKTDTEGLYFINQTHGQAAVRYMDFIEIEDRDHVIGYVLLDLTQKRRVPNSVFPLLQNENLYASQIEGTDEYSYGVFQNGELQYNYGEFNYLKNQDDFSTKADRLFDYSVRIQGFNHKGFRGEGNKFVIVSDKLPTAEAWFANFSFLFLVFIFSMLFVRIVITVYQGFRQVKLNYATKIQLYLNFAFFTPLIIVSVTTVSIIIQTFKTSLEDQYLEYADNLSAEFSKPLGDYRNLKIEKEDLSDIIFQVAEIADMDVNVYNINGRLLASSLYQIYQNEILSGNIEPNAFIKIVEDQESSFVQEEQVGLLHYKSVYVGIRSYDTGAIIGILSLPFFASQQDLERNIVEVLSNIINIFTFVFIIFLIVSFFVSRGLTFPLRLITQKIKRTTLSAYNEPLSWNSDDELGLMVKEYNRMLLNLEASKRALAESEKESAWREMARQVAHEIKNPLTPMKLTLQHMKRVIHEEDNGDLHDQKLKQIHTLLEQIETLSDIATSFSDFAKMPEPQMELLELSSLLTDTVELYDKKELGRITSSIEHKEFWVKGDKKWLGRAFSNLIINGFQSVNDKEIAHVEVNLFATDKKVARLEIKDNGNGIPDDIRDKIFTPNFSTKYTGSGLGLAITKKGVEYSGGEIWFRSEIGAGTTFYIEIPFLSNNPE